MASIFIPSCPYLISARVSSASSPPSGTSHYPAFDLPSPLTSLIFQSTRRHLLYTSLTSFALHAKAVPFSFSCVSPLCRSGLPPSGGPQPGHPRDMFVPGGFEASDLWVATFGPLTAEGIYEDLHGTKRRNGKIINCFHMQQVTALFL